MVAPFLLVVVVLMWWFPNTPLVRSLHELTVVRIAGWDRRHVLFALIALPFVLAGGEAVAIFGSYDLAVVLAWDISLYLDAVLGITVVGTIGRLVRSRAASSSPARDETRVARSARWLSLTPGARRPMKHS